MTTIAPKKLLLTCTLTGKVATWTNQKIIQAKIDQFGSLEAFTAQYQSKGAGEVVKAKAQIPKPVLEQGVVPSKKTPKEYTPPPPASVVHQHGYEQVTEVRNGVEYITRKWTNEDRSTCTVTAPAPKASTVVDHHEVDTTRHAASKAFKAIKGRTWKGVAL
jgi:hypothetical protein